MKKKNTWVYLIYFLLVLLLLAFGIYSYYTDNNNELSEYAFFSYDIEELGYKKVNNLIDKNKVYILYEGSNQYLLKVINIESNKIKKYYLDTNKSCKLQNEESNPYIVCKDESNLYLYDTEFNLIVNNAIKNKSSYVINKKQEYHLISDKTNFKSGACFNNNCYLIKDDGYKDSLYNNDDLLESNIKYYKKYAKGYFTVDNKIKIYNIFADSYQEFIAPENIDKKKLALGAANYLYVLDKSVIKVYDLSKQNVIANIDISKIKDNINEIDVVNNYLYVYTFSNLYLYDIGELENNFDEKTKYENELIDKKVQYFKNNYRVNMQVLLDPIFLDPTYQMRTADDLVELIDALNSLEDFFAFFNKDFFAHFYEFGMNGLDIYFVTDLKSDVKEAEVVGLYKKSNNKYNIIIRLNPDESVFKIISHEIMHLIDGYLENTQAFNSWSSLNPIGFNYEHIYYLNEKYMDTLSAYNDSQNVYFIDNYARSSEKEDRARIFEAICSRTDYQDYPYLQAKMDYLKETLQKYFPELSYVDIFN